MLILHGKLQRGEEVGEVLLRMRQVHLVQQDDLDGVPPSSSAGLVQRLEKLRFVEPLLEGVVVADQILRVPPAGLHLDLGGLRAGGAGERHRQAGLAGSADALQKDQAAHGESANEAAKVGQRVEQGRRWCSGDTVLQVLDEGFQFDAFGLERLLGLELRVFVHTRAGGEGCSSFASAVQVFDLRPEFHVHLVQQLSLTFQ